MEHALRPTVDVVERLLAPLDRLRTRILHLLMPVSGWLAGRREPRVAVVGVSAVLLALGLTVIAPLWLLALGPIVLGVPHLLADLRYCVVRPGWHRERVLWLTAGVPLLALALGAPLEYGLAGVAASALAMDGSTLRRWAVAIGALGLALLARQVGSLADLVFAHGHNLIAVGLWAAWRPRAGKAYLWVLATFVLASVALAAGLADGVWLGEMPAGLRTADHLKILAPASAGDWGLRLVLLYCFAQSVHYGVWLRLLPEDDRARPTPRSFGASYRALRSELGGWVLGVFALASVVLALWACVDLAEARDGYLRFARCHGSLELIAAGLLIAGGRRYGGA